MLKLCNVSKIYNSNGINTTGLHNISLELFRNEIVVITGQSGCGKSTLLNVITKMDNFDEGEIYYKGNETSYFDVNDMDDFRKNKVGFIFQNYNILDSYSVLENVMIPLKLKGIPKEEAKKKALELIDKVGLSHRIKNRGTELSGGEKQRCVIARALASDCEIFACDEPTGNLDSKTGAEIINLIKEVAKDKLVLIVTHNPDEVKDIATRTIKMHDGQIMEDIIVKDTKTIDANEEINLDYVPVKEKTKFDISKSNILNTPKKTILISLVLLFVCVFTLFLYQSIYYSSDNFSISNSFAYQSENKEFAYNVDGNKLDLDALKNSGDHVVVNDFNISSTQSVNIKDYNEISVGVELYPDNLNNLIGRMPTSNDEVVLLLDYETDTNLIDKTVILSDVGNLKLINKEFKIVGYKIDKNLKNSMLCCNEYILNYYKLTKLNFEFESEELRVYYNPQTTSKVVGKESVSCKVKTASYLRYSFDININLPYETNEDSYIVIGSDILDIVNSTVYEASVYGNYKTISSNLNKLGYTHLNTAKYDETSELMKVISNIEGYVLIFFSSLLLIIVYFISYVLLSKIFQAKNKDYLVLRTLGVTKKDMASVVRIELMIETILMEIIVFLVFFIISRFVKTGLFLVFTKLNPLVIVIYFVVMTLFGYLLSNRLNVRLFKFSVSKSLKKGDAK